MMPSAAIFSPVEESCSGEGSEEIVAVKERCEECSVEEAKYRCPGCDLRSCGVQCVKAHKERTKCNGKRKRTSFVNINHYDDNWLISDYNLLEETLRQADAAKRLREPLAASKNELHPALKALQKQAKSRSTTLLYVAHGMTRRKTNTSYYDRKTKRIFWRVEWVFEGTDLRLVDERVDENLNLGDVLAKHLTHEGETAMVGHRLRNFRWQPLSELKLVLPKEQCSAANKEYYGLSLTETLRDQLADKSIIEYPIIHVLLPAAAGKYALVVKPPPKVPDQAPEDVPSTPTLQEPEGVPLREEEFEEGECEIEEGEILP